MAATKRKYNPERGRQRVRSFYMRCAASKINNLLKGVTVSHNLKWVQDVEENGEIKEKLSFYTNGLERLQEHLNNTAKKPCAFSTMIEAPVQWRVYVKVHYTTQDGTDYDWPLPVINQKRPFCEIFFYILNEFLPNYRKKENSLHFVEWSFYGEVV